MSRPLQASDDLLEQLVHQFSDPYAFWRELIQNSIDAGSTRIEATLRYTPGAGGAPGLALAQVADWGDGMSREIIEKYLLTKFRSSKEDDLTKIGKFGIGFMSVFAPGPELVVVDTSRDGDDWRLLFRRDRSYELLRSPEPADGTRVALYLPRDAAGYRELAARSAEAVRRWCRHSEVDITFAAGGADGSPPPAPEPVREAFHVDAPFEVEHREEGTHVVAGPARRSPPPCGFYNRGLLLLEVDQPFVPGVTFKIASRWLEHTLTRDDVRRDKHFGKAIALVQKLARGPLRQRLREELRRAAAIPDSPDFLPLLHCAALHLEPRELCFPLVDGGVADGAALLEQASRLGFAVVASLKDPLVDALSAQQTLVLPDTLPEAAIEALGRGRRTLGVFAVKEPLRTRRSEEAFTVALEDPSEPARKLSSALERILLAGAGLEARRIAVGRVLGAGSEELASLVDEPGRAEPAPSGPRSPFHEGRRATLVFNAAHPQVVSALALAARQSPPLAALLCARLLAVHWGELDERADRSLTAAALAAAAGEPR